MTDTGGGCLQTKHSADEGYTQQNAGLGSCCVCSTAQANSLLSAQWCSGQDSSHTNYSFWVKIERRNNLFENVVLTVLSNFKVGQLAFKKSRSRKTVFYFRFYKNIAELEFFALIWVKLHVLRYVKRKKASSRVLFFYHVTLLGLILS